MTTEPFYQLYLVFKTENNTPYTVVIQQPKVGLPAFFIQQTMKQMIELQLFKPKDGHLIEIIESYYIRTNQHNVMLPVLHE